MPTDRPRSLMYRALELLQKTDQPHHTVAKAIGVTPAWVRMFRNGDIKDPGVNTIQRLYEYLAGRPLFKD